MARTKPVDGATRRVFELVDLRLGDLIRGTGVYRIDELPPVVRPGRYSARIQEKVRDRKFARSRTRRPRERNQTERLIREMQTFLAIQWDGKPHAAHTTFDGWQAKQLHALASDVQRLAFERYEIASEQSYSKPKKDAGRDPGDDVAKDKDQ